MNINHGAIIVLVAHKFAACNSVTHTLLHVIQAGACSSGYG